MKLVSHKELHNEWMQEEERMGVTPPVISRLENNITRASIDTGACNLNCAIALYYGTK